MPNQLHRFDTYPHSPINEHKLVHQFQGEHGLFQLKLDSGSNFNFELTTPTGAIVQDSLHWIEDREHLYNLLDKNIYAWLQKSFEEKLGVVMVNAGGFTIMKVIDTEQYILTVDRATNKCRLEYPARVREFDLEDIYFSCSDLPILYDAMLDQHFREKLKDIGIEMPKAPYIPLLTVVNKND